MNDSQATVPIGTVEWRRRVRVRGRVSSMRVQPWGASRSLEVVLHDGTGGLLVVFLGRPRVGGITLGSTMTVEGVAGSHRGYLAVLNPAYTLELPPA